MATKKSKTAQAGTTEELAAQTQESKHECNAESSLSELVDVSRGFYREIENIMTTTGLSENNRANLLGQATKYFAEEVERLGK